MLYCRFGNFRENFIFANCIKRHIRDVKNSRLRQDLPIPINDRVILPFREDFIFAKLRFAKIKSSRKFPNLQYTNRNDIFPQLLLPKLMSKPKLVSVT